MADPIHCAASRNAPASRGAEGAAAVIVAAGARQAGTGRPHAVYLDRDGTGPLTEHRRITTLAQPLRIIGEVLGLKGHSPQMLRDMRDHLEELKLLGLEAIKD